MFFNRYFMNVLNFEFGTRVQRNIKRSDGSHKI